VRVTKGNCADTSNCLLVTSLEGFVSKGSDLQIMPNPSFGKATIVWNNGKEGEQISIFNLAGKLIKTARLNGAKSAVVSGLPAGVYVVKAKGVKPERMLVE